MLHSLSRTASTRQDLAGDAGNRELYRLAQQYPLPDFVKKADLSAHRDPPRPDPKLYADTRRPYQFACHTPEATVLSALYFYDKAASFAAPVAQKIEERLHKFASHWNVTNAVADIQNHGGKAHEEEPASDSPADYAINVKVAGVYKRRVPLRTAQEVQKAASWFRDNLDVMRQNMTFLNRQAVATRILDKAAEHCVTLGENQDLLEKSAGYGAADADSVALALIRRSKMVQDAPEELRQGLTKLAAAIRQNPRMMLDPAVTSQLAEAVDGFDRVTNLLTKYSSVTPAPENMIFAVTHHKIAETVKTSCQLVNGEIYNQDQFSALSLSDLSEAFGESFARRVANGLTLDTEKLANVASTLPRNDADMLSVLLEEKNEYPIAVDSA